MEPLLPPERPGGLPARPASKRPVRPAPTTLSVIGLLAFAGGALLAAGLLLSRGGDKTGDVASAPGPGGSSTTAPSEASESQPPTPVGATPAGSTPVGAKFNPVHTNAGTIGAEILLAPGPDGGLYISIPKPDSNETVLALLDRNGGLREGWPIIPDGAAGCGELLVAAGGSVRLICDQVRTPQAPEIGDPDVLALAFGPDGQSLAGWPVEIPCCFSGRVIGEDLTVLRRHWIDDDVNTGEVAGTASVVTVAADGSVRTGAEVPFVETCCGDEWGIGPDGVAYLTVHRGLDTPFVTTELIAIGMEGVRAGWPIDIEANASGPAFSLDGRVYFVLGSPASAPAKTFVLERDGRPVQAGSDDLGIVSTPAWNGAGGFYPGLPIVADDGTAFIISTRDGTEVVALNPAGGTMSGWPYRNDAGLEWTGGCGSGDVGCGQYRTEPAVGPGNVLYMIHAQAARSAGGSLVAISPDGRIREGWPVALKREGSEFWSVVVAPDGTAYTLAIEPEAGGAHSATVLGIAPDSTVLYRTTIVEP